MAHQDPSKQGIRRRDFIRAVGGGAVALAAADVLVGCGGGGSAGGGSLTEVQRLAALDRVRSTFATIKGPDAHSESQQLAGFMQGLPEFEAAGVNDDNNAWGRFLDGQALIIVNNQPPSRAVPTALTAHSRVAGSSLPDAPRGYVVNMLGPSTADTQISSMLSGNGYNVVPIDGSVDSLKVLSNVGAIALNNAVGVIVLDGHGSDYTNKKGERVFVINTTTPVSFDNNARYADDRSAGRIGWMMYKSNTNPPTEHVVYGITYHFVDTYWKNLFSSNALVFVSACSSNNPVSAPFRDACINAGASCYAGWTAAVPFEMADRASIYAFDRLIGATKTGATNAALRPTDYEAVKAEMSAKGLDKANYLGVSTELIFTRNVGDFGLLAPSISTVVAAQTTFSITGIFGSNPGARGKVTVNGTDAIIREWTPGSITCTLPAIGGDVVVLVDGRKSNAVKLTVTSNTGVMREMFVCLIDDVYMVSTISLGGSYTSPQGVTTLCHKVSLAPGKHTLTVTFDEWDITGFEYIGPPKYPLNLGFKITSADSLSQNSPYVNVNSGSFKVNSVGDSKSFEIEVH